MSDVEQAANQITTLANTVADRIGLAADKLAPIGQQMVTETANSYAFSAYVFFALTFICGLIALLMVYVGLTTPQQ